MYLFNIPVVTVYNFTDDPSDGLKISPLEEMVHRILPMHVTKLTSNFGSISVILNNAPFVSA